MGLPLWEKKKIKEARKIGKGIDFAFKTMPKKKTKPWYNNGVLIK